MLSRITHDQWGQPRSGDSQSGYWSRPEIEQTHGVSPLAATAQGGVIGAALGPKKAGKWLSRKGAGLGGLIFGGGQLLYNNLHTPTSKTAKDNHVEKRRKERAKHLPKSVISKLKKSIKDNQSKIPKGTQHIKLPGATGVLKDIGNKHVLATILGPNMKPPGTEISKFIKKHPYVVDTGVLATDVAIKGGTLL
tara:strand:- start:18022 stop:18600 length:579 start_codon:yes stop_codon:yes gene_type:complete